MKQQTTLLLIVFLLFGWNLTYSQDSNKLREKKPTSGYIPVFKDGNLIDSKMYYPPNSSPYMPDTMLTIDSPIAFNDSLFMPEPENYINLSNDARNTSLSFIRKSRTVPQGKTLMTIMDKDRIAVGIGTDTPASMLDVAGKTRTEKFAMSYSAEQGDILQSIDSDGNTQWVDPHTLNISPWKRNNPDIYYSSGNVGINTSTPNYDLDVNGSIAVSTMLRGNNGLFTGDLSINGKLVNQDATLTNVKIGDITMNNNSLGIYSGSYELMSLHDNHEIYMNGGVQADELVVTNNAQFSSDVTINGNLSANTGDFSGTVVMNNLKTRADNTLEIRQANNSPIMTLEPDLVTIGNSNYDNTTDLTVDGKITAQEVLVVQDVWADHVFSDEYDLRSLESLENYIHIQHKLPGIPDEEKVKEEGVNVSEMNARLLEKIEELTLYTIEQHKTIEKQQDMLNQLIQDIKALKNEK